MFVVKRSFDRVSLIRRCLLSTRPSTNLPIDQTKEKRDPSLMTPIDPAQLSELEQVYVKRFEERHFRNVERRQKERKRARIIGLSFGALVIGIYLYTIFRVRQETFLDDFDVPEPPPLQKKPLQNDWPTSLVFSIDVERNDAESIVRHLNNKIGNRYPSILNETRKTSDWPTSSF